MTLSSINRTIYTKIIHEIRSKNYCNYIVLIAFIFFMNIQMTCLGFQMEKMSEIGKTNIEVTLQLCSGVRMI